MPAAVKVLIVGGGTAGCGLATLLARQGIAVEIAEVKPNWVARGSGITLMGSALRVLREVGVLSDIVDSGFAFDSAGIRAPTGELLNEVPEHHTGGPDVPASLGMTRPRLAEILSGAATAAGAHVRLGVTVEAFADDGAGVDVRFSDGTSARYDLVAGADGIRSRTRAMLGIDVAPSSTGLGIWRVQAPRPTEVTRIDLHYGGVFYLAGYTPTGENTLYTWLFEDIRDRTATSPAEKLALVRDGLAAYGGAWRRIREDVNDAGQINYTEVEWLLVPQPWHRGRVVLVGDAVHACPPTLAQGAAMALEDASILAELLLGADQLDDALLQRFCARRFERARTVVEGSVQLCRWMLEPSADADPGALIGRIAAVITQPA